MKFKCEQCGFQTGISSVFKNHQLIHSDERPFKCDICDYRALRRGDLKQHVATHSDERPFKCDICEYRARRRTHLRKHVATHSEVRPFKCDICEYRTRRRDDLKKHVATHSEDRPFKCDICEYCTQTIWNLKNHVATHNDERPFKCDFCEYRARRRDVLKSHVATHSEDHPFKCGICNYRTRHRGNLNIHNVTHSDERPFKCNFCDFATKLKRVLKDHIARRHPSKSLIERKIPKSVSSKRKNQYDQSTSKRKRASTKDNAGKPNQGNIESKLSDSSEVRSESRSTAVADIAFPLKLKPDNKRRSSQPERSGPNTNHDSLNGIAQSKELEIHSESDPDDPRYARESNSTLSESVGSNFNQGISLLGEFNTLCPTITSENIKKEPEIPESSDDNFSLKFDLNCVKLENETATPLPANEAIYGPNSDASRLESNVKWEEPIDHLNFLKYEFGFDNNDAVDQDNQFTIKQCSIILTKLEDSGNYHGCYYVKVKEPPYLYEVVKVNLNPVI